MQLTRNLFIPCIDTNRGKDAEGGGSNYNWVPVDLSTQFELSYNPSTDTKSYINAKSDSTVLTTYALSMPQEIVLDNTNPMYKFIFGLSRELPLGSSSEMPVLIITPDLETGEPTVGDVWKKALVTLDTLNTVDGTLTFNLALNGDAVPGTVSGAGTDKITFTPGDKPPAPVAGRGRAGKSVVA